MVTLPELSTVNTKVIKSVVLPLGIVKVKTLSGSLVAGGMSFIPVIYFVIFYALKSVTVSVA
jgi:hypothetical protein